MSIADNLREVQARVARAALACGRDPQTITVLAVSKTFDHLAVLEAMQTGQHDFGENYLQEALDKQQAVAHPEMIWHFIGPIQSNKTRGIAENFAWVHSIDRFKIAERLSAQRPIAAPPLNVCIEVNVNGEASKSGVLPEALGAFVDEVAGLPQLKTPRLDGDSSPHNRSGPAARGLPSGAEIARYAQSTRTSSRYLVHGHVR